MPSHAGQGGKRVDCKNLSMCKHHSLYYCRLYCDNWESCEFLSHRSKLSRLRKRDNEPSNE